MPDDTACPHIPARYLLYIWKNSIKVTITTPTTPRTVTTPTIPLDLIDALCMMLPTLAVDPERKAAIMQVSKKKPTTIATTSNISGFASPIPSMGFEPDVKSDSFISAELEAAAAVFINTILKSNSKSAVLPNCLIFPILIYTIYKYLRLSNTNSYTIVNVAFR